MIDPFFTKSNCDRCNGPLITRTMSWFTEETICMECSKKESEIKRALTEQGNDTRAYEGCGYIPKLGAGI